MTEPNIPAKDNAKSVETRVPPSFMGAASRKLEELIGAGFLVSGYAIERPASDPGDPPTRGFITAGGMVGWWAPGQPPNPALSIDADGKLTGSVSDEQLDVLLRSAVAQVMERNGWTADTTPTERELAMLVMRLASDLKKLDPGSQRVAMAMDHLKRKGLTSPLRAEANVEVGPHGLDTPSRVCFYEHDFYPLSNFSSFTLMWGGIRFDTSEAAYHWEKFPSEDGIQYAIRTAPSAHEAYRVAERYKAHRRPDWDEVKVDIMRRILRSKVEQHEYVRRKLLATGARELVEDSWRDDFWGWGENRNGQNMLGKLWMEVRDEIQSKGQRS
jgi:hypothetical protein